QHEITDVVPGDVAAEAQLERGGAGGEPDAEIDEEQGLQVARLPGPAGPVPGAWEAWGAGSRPRRRLGFSIPDELDNHARLPSAALLRAKVRLGYNVRDGRFVTLASPRRSRTTRRAACPILPRVVLDRRGF